MNLKFVFNLGKGLTIWRYIKKKKIFQYTLEYITLKKKQ